MGDTAQDNKGGRIHSSRPIKSEQPAMQVVRSIKSKISTKIPREKEIQKNYADPWLNDRGGDLRKKWYVGYKVRDPKTDQWKYPQEYISSKKYKTAKERYERGKVLIEAIKELLKEHYEDKKQPTSEINQKLFIVPAIQSALANIKNKLELTTYNSYNSVANKLFDWIKANEMEGMYIHEFKTKQAAAFCQHLGNIVNSNRTFNNNKTHLSSIFKELKRSMHVIDHNPWHEIENRKVSKPKKGIWTAKDLKKYLQSVKQNDHQLYIASLFVFHVYARPIELTRLKVEDIDLNKGLVWLEIKKGDDYRKEPGSLSSELSTLLKKAIKDLPKDVYFFSRGLQPGRHKIVPQRFGKSFRAIRDKLDLERPKCEFYELKHTGNSIAKAKGVPMENIQLQNRHTSITTTENYIRELQIVNDNYFKNFPELKDINY